MIWYEHVVRRSQMNQTHNTQLMCMDKVVFHLKRKLFCQHFHLFQKKTTVNQNPRQKKHAQKHKKPTHQGRNTRPCTFGCYIDYHIGHYIDVVPKKTPTLTAHSILVRDRLHSELEQPPRDDV